MAGLIESMILNSLYDNYSSYNTRNISNNIRYNAKGR